MDTLVEQTVIGGHISKATMWSPRPPNRQAAGVVGRKHRIWNPQINSRQVITLPVAELLSGSYTVQGLLCPTGQPGDPRRGTQHRPAPCGTGGKQPLPPDPGSTRRATGNPGPVTPGRGAVCLSLRWGGPGMREGGPRSLPGTPVSGTSWAGGNARWLEWNTHRETGGPGRAHPPAQSSHLTMPPCPPQHVRVCSTSPTRRPAVLVPAGRVGGSRVCPLRAGRRHSAQRPSPKPPTSREGQPTKHCGVPDGRAALRNRI